MEDWQKEFWSALENVTVEVERFFDDVGELIVMVTEELEETLEEITVESTQTIAPEIEQFLQEMFDPIIEIYTEFEVTFGEDEEVTLDREFDFNPKVEPNRETHPACIGCRNYHGRVYSGNLLVCGIHPYGWNGETCPDWEE